MIYYNELIALRAAYLRAIASGQPAAIRAITAALGAAHKRAAGVAS
jgi:hypothetical protein